MFQDNKLCGKMESVRRNTTEKFHYLHRFFTVYLNRMVERRATDTLVSFGLRRLLLGNIIQKHSQKSGIPPWKRPLFQYSLFFMFGFLLGISPITDVEDLHRRQDLSFEIRPSLHTDLT
ncbi:hypothetical protein MRB53_034518 [Persea americana]|uniref:Uncharacterized protein n=1 Tax=Persea americana TaxID=3435 RepID=A0ACC2K201_PERAE|nr:hypothetical protein MRB53_034518 [Persea americana]